MGDDDFGTSRIWIGDLRDAPKTELWKCKCAGRSRCGYHRVDWPLVLDVVVGEFRMAYGEGPVEFHEAYRLLWPRIERRLSDRRHSEERAFAWTLFTEPVEIHDGFWTNGQHRSQAAIDAGCVYTILCE